jgi:hypothetical protein
MSHIPVPVLCGRGVPVPSLVHYLQHWALESAWMSPVEVEREKVAHSQEDLDAVELSWEPSGWGPQAGVRGRATSSNNMLHVQIIQEQVSNAFTTQRVWGHGSVSLLSVTMAHWTSYDSRSCNLSVFNLRTSKHWTWQALEKPRIIRSTGRGGCSLVAARLPSLSRPWAPSPTPHTQTKSVSGNPTCLARLRTAAITTLPETV